MRHRGHFQRFSLAVMLLVSGVLGELMAPMTSDAQTPAASRPTLTIEVTFNNISNGIQPILVNPTLVACPLNSAFNYCYGLDATALTSFYGPVGHQFNIQNYSGTAPVRINVVDLPTSGNTNPADTIVLTGMKLVPITSWGSTDNVVVKLTVTNKFDAQPNPPANGSTSFYPFGMSVGGTFATNPSPAGNVYQMYGTGIFETNGTAPFGPATGQPKNIANQFNPHANFNVTPGTADTKCYGTPLSAGGTKYPLCQYIAGATSTQASFSAQQNPAYYPGGSTSVDTTTRFKCTNNRTGTNKQVIDPRGVTRTYNDPSCQPEITETHKFSIRGPDQIIFTTSSHGGGGVCSDEQGVDIPPLPSCLCTTTTKLNKASTCNAIKSLHENAKSAEDIENAIIGAQPVIECDDVICSGILKLNITVTRNPPIGTVFPFKVEGPGGGAFTITTTANGTGILNPPLDHLITGHGGAEGGPAPLAILPDYDNPAWPRPDANSYYEVDQFQVGSLNGSTILATDTQLVSCPGGHKGPVLINAIGRNAAGQGDTVTVGIHIHKAQSPPAVCPF
ncbi:MAG: hypothetical protein HP491_18040 [Nitrospira sp.]|nr:hypothetical protein [Nitrospira sp.]MBH0187223.1 hypothetical protein [Nitrospira sp.]